MGLFLLFATDVQRTPTTKFVYTCTSLLNKIHSLFLFKFQSGRQFVFIGNFNRIFPFNMFKGCTKSAHGESGGEHFHFSQLVALSDPILELELYYLSYFIRETRACGDGGGGEVEATFATAFGNL